MGAVIILVFCVVFIQVEATEDTQTLDDGPVLNLEETSETGLRSLKDEDAPNYTFPFVAALLYNSGTLRCTASIIHEKWILTSASCINNFKKSQMFILVGGKTTKKSKGRSYDIKQLHPHPQYDAKNQTNNIGLVELKKNLQWSKSVRPIRLGPVKPEDEVPLVFTGYGEAYGSDSKKRFRLKTRTFITLSDEDCEEPSRPNPQGWKFCAHGEQLCDEDDGGALVELQSSTQVGVLSDVNSCCKKEPLEVFTKVSPFLPWIESVTGVDLATKSHGGYCLLWWS